MATTISEIVNFVGVDPSYKPYPNMDQRFGPYSSVEGALAELPSNRRAVGLRVGVKNPTYNEIIEYWFQGGIEDSNLVKVPSTTEYQEYRGVGGVESDEVNFHTKLRNIVDSAYFIKVNSNINSPVTVEITFNPEEQVAVSTD